MKPPVFDPQYGEDFIGRDKEIEELEKNIRNNSIVIVTGQRGIGKTNLLQIVIKKIKEKKNVLSCETEFISDGELFSARIKDIFGPRIYKKQITDSVSVPGATHEVSWGIKENDILYYMIKHKPIIIFIDNAQKLKPKEIAGILDACNNNKKLRFVLEVATPYKIHFLKKMDHSDYEIQEIGKLDAKTTRKLINQLNQKNEINKISEKNIEEIVLWSDGFPYFARILTIICGKMENEEHVIQFLKNFTKNNENDHLRIIHDQVFKIPNGKSRELLKIVAAAPEIFTYTLIKAFSSEEISAQYNELVDIGIIIESNKTGKLYHPLFREYLRVKNRDPDENIILDLYCKVINSINEDDLFYILSEFADKPEQFKILIKKIERKEVINSVALRTYLWGDLDLAYDLWKYLHHVTKNDKYWESRICENLGYIKKIHGDLSTSLKYHNNAFLLFNELGDKEGEARQLSCIGQIYGIQGDPNNALENHKKALDLYEEIDFSKGIAEEFGNIGQIYRIQGELEMASENHNKALELYKKINFFQGLAEEYGNIGQIYYIQGELKKSLEFHEKALKLHEEIGFKQRIAEEYGNIGQIYRIQGELKKALEFHEKALKLHEEIGFKQGIAENQGNLGNLYMIKGNYEIALQYCVSALNIFKEIKDERGKANQFGNIGNIYLIRGDFSNSLTNHKSALDIDTKLKYKQGIAEDLENLGVLYRMEGNFTNALNKHEEAYSIAKDIGYKLGIVNNLGNIGIIHQAFGKSDRAFECHKKAYDIADELGYKQGVGNELCNLGLVYFVKGDQIEAESYFNQAFTIFQDLNDKRGMSNINNNISLLYNFIGSYETALDYLEKSAKIYEEIGLSKEQASIFIKMGELFERQCNFAEARKKYINAKEVYPDENKKNEIDIKIKSLEEITYRKKILCHCIRFIRESNINGISKIKMNKLFLNHLKTLGFLKQISNRDENRT